MGDAGLGYSDMTEAGSGPGQVFGGEWEEWGKVPEMDDGEDGGVEVENIR